MLGKWKGLATVITKEEAQAIPVHCLTHCLNLCLQDIRQQLKSVHDALDLMKEILQLIKLSPKREHLFSSLKDNISPGLRPLCPTRWTVRTASINSVLSNYAVLMDTMEDINRTTNDEYLLIAGRQLTVMEKFSTFFQLKLSHLFFSASEQLSHTLQNEDISIHDATKAIGLCCDFYAMQREAKFYEFYQYVCDEAQKIPDIGQPSCIDENAMTTHVFSNPKELYKKQYYEMMDLMLGELQERLSSSRFSVIVDMEKILIQSANGRNVEIPQCVRELYCCDIDFDKLKVQLQMLPTLCQVGSTGGPKEVTMISTITDAMLCANTSVIAKSMLSEVNKLLQLFLTIPVTAERHFSTLRRVKTYLQ